MPCRSLQRRPRSKLFCTSPERARGREIDSLLISQGSNGEGAYSSLLIARYQSVNSGFVCGVQICFMSAPRVTETSQNCVESVSLIDISDDLVDNDIVMVDVGQLTRCRLASRDEHMFRCTCTILELAFRSLFRLPLKLDEYE